jgi:cytochrome c2/cytochrome b561
MSAEVRERAGERRDSRIVGWAFCLLMIAHSLLIVVLPRLDKESAIRDLARSWHYAIGIGLLVFGIWRIALWVRDRGALLPSALPPAARFWHNALALAVLLLVVSSGPLGFFYGWAEGRVIDPAGILTIPAPIGKDYAVWQFTGYFHSALANATVLIALIAVVSAGYTYARYGKGLLRAFPAGFGVLFLCSAALFIYAVNSFKERTPGYVAAAVFLAIILAFWLAVRFLSKSERSIPTERPRGLLALNSMALTAVLGVIGLGLTMPYLLFQVTPIAKGVVVKADPAITWHTNRLIKVEWTEPTPFELTTGRETYKWCKFCHTMQPGEAHLVGPNLANIFGQRAGTVPNYPYSEALARAGREGLVWNDETIRQFIAGPDKMIPGTSMMISSGPVTDPALQDAVIASLKRDTMFAPGERPDAARGGEVGR